MSQTSRHFQALRWLKTAESDLRAAEILSSSGAYPQACFFAQQSAEKAMKALWYFNDLDPWGHSVLRLIEDFPNKLIIKDHELLLKKASLLDKFYIPTRYPNGLPDLTPSCI